MELIINNYGSLRTLRRSFFRQPIMDHRACSLDTSRSYKHKIWGAIVSL